MLAQSISLVEISSRLWQIIQTGDEKRSHICHLNAMDFDHKQHPYLCYLSVESRGLSLRRPIQELLEPRAAFPETWIDFNRDVLYVDFDHPLEALSLDVKRVENFAVSSRKIQRHLNFGYSPRNLVDREFLIAALICFGHTRKLMQRIT